MKKKLAIVLAILIMTAFSGCNSIKSKFISQNSDAVAGGNNRSFNAESGGETYGRSRQMSADLTGEVISVNEREVSLKVVEMPGFGGMPAPGNENNMPPNDRPAGDEANGQRIGGGRPDMAPGDGFKRGEGRPDMASGDGFKMGGGRPGMASGDGFKMDGDRPPMEGGFTPKMELTYTGETTSITIPEGVSISEMTRGENGVQQEELTIADIKEGDILQIWYSDKDKGVAEKVRITKKS